MIRRAPYIFAYMPYDQTNFETGCYKFSDLLRKLSAVSDYTRGYKVLTNEEATLTGEGLDPIHDMDEVIAFLRNLHFETGIEPVMNSVWGERWIDGRQITNISYRWGGRQGDNFQRLEYEKWGGIIQSEGAGLNLWLRIVETIINWKYPQFLWCGDDAYFRKGKGVFNPDRTIANWFCWTPQQVDPDLIPSAALVRPMLDGTLIVTSEQYFNIDDEAAIHRANDVEVEMNEAGILPSLDDLRKV